MPGAQFAPFVYASHRSARARRAHWVRGCRELSTTRDPHLPTSPEYGHSDCMVSEPAGLVRRCTALDHGYTDGELHRSRRRGDLLTVRRGAYLRRDDDARLDTVGRHRVLAHATALASHSDAAVSHVSALALHGIDLWNVPLALVHMTANRTQGGKKSRRRRRRAHHRAGAKRAERAVAFMNGLSDSVGESRSRRLFHDGMEKYSLHPTRPAADPRRCHSHRRPSRRCGAGARSADSGLRPASGRPSPPAAVPGCLRRGQLFRRRGCAR